MPRCSYCNSNMVWGIGILEEGRWIEENCYRIKLLKKISVFKEKMASGKITLEEVKEFQDCEQLHENLIHEQKSIKPQKQTDHLINKICFGKRTDTHELLKSGELNEMLNFTEINTKPKMNAIFCPSPDTIIPYSKQKLLESKKTDMQLIKNHEDALQTKKKRRVRVNRGVNIEREMK